MCKGSFLNLVWIKLTAVFYEVKNFYNFMLYACLFMKDVTANLKGMF